MNSNVLSCFFLSASFALRSILLFRFIYELMVFALSRINRPSAPSPTGRDGSGAVHGNGAPNHGVSRRRRSGFTSASRAPGPSSASSTAAAVTCAADAPNGFLEETIRRLQNNYNLVRCILVNPPLLGCVDRPN